MNTQRQLGAQSFPLQKLGPKNCVFFRDPKIAFFEDGQPSRPIETQGCRFQAYLIQNKNIFGQIIKKNFWLRDGINFGSQTKGRRIAAKEFAAKQVKN